MNYELAKQLKDAGFPQKETNGDRYAYSGDITVLDYGVYVPTLSELIEACGEEITLWKCEKRCGGHWHAGQGGTMRECQIVDNSFMGSATSGSTPEEAVAKLWLELNKK